MSVFFVVSHCSCFFSIHDHRSFFMTRSSFYLLVSSDLIIYFIIPFVSFVSYFIFIFPISFNIFILCCLWLSLFSGFCACWVFLSILFCLPVLFLSSVILFSFSQFPLIFLYRAACDCPYFRDFVRVGFSFRSCFAFPCCFCACAGVPLFFARLLSIFVVRPFSVSSISFFLRLCFVIVFSYFFFVIPVLIFFLFSFFFVLSLSFFVFVFVFILVLLSTTSSTAYRKVGFGALAQKLPFYFAWILSVIQT